MRQQAEHDRAVDRLIPIYSRYLDVPPVSVA
jgi:hypothetical protein